MSQGVRPPSPPLAQVFVFQWFHLSRFRVSGEYEGKAQAHRLGKFTAALLIQLLLWRRDGPGLHILLPLCIRLLFSSVVCSVANHRASGADYGMMKLYLHFCPIRQTKRRSSFTRWERERKYSLLPSVHQKGKDRKGKSWQPPFELSARAEIQHHHTLDAHIWVVEQYGEPDSAGKEWAWNPCNIGQRWSREETMKRASCFVILFPVDNQLHVAKEASKSNRLTV